MPQIIQLLASRRDHYELLAYSVRSGYASAMTGDPIKMFEPVEAQGANEQPTTNKSDREKVDELNKLFE